MSSPERDRPQNVPWRLVFEQAAAAAALLDLRGNYLYVNAALCELLGYSMEELLSYSYRDVTHPEDVDLTAPYELGSHMPKRYITASGRVLWVLLSRSLIRDSEGREQYFLSQFQDVTARREVELRWERSFANAPIGMALLDLKGHWTEVNDALCEIVGYSGQELLAKSFLDLTYPEDIERGTKEFDELVRGQRGSINVEKRYRHKDGHPLSMLIRATAVPGPDGKPAYVVGQYEDLGERRLLNAHLAHLALHDPLTGLANRALLSDRLELALAQLAHRTLVLTVVLADLDRLKQANDLYGHAFGDRLLIAAAKELRAVAPGGDTVARLGGDEFVVASLLPDQQAARSLRDRVAQRLDTDYVSGMEHARPRASVGMATTDDPRTSPDDLLHRADQDMYANKKLR